MLLFSSLAGRVRQQGLLNAFRFSRGLWFLPPSLQVWFRGRPIEGAVCLPLNGVLGVRKRKPHPSPEGE